MSPNHAILAVLHLFASFSFLGTAVFFFSLPFLPKVRLQICEILLASPKVFFQVGVAFFTASMFLTLGFYLFHRGRSLRICMKQNRVSVDPKVILKTIEELFQNHFKEQVELSDLYISQSGKIEIEVFLKSPDQKALPETITSLEEQIAPLLKERFGYAKPFFLNLKG